MKALGHSDLTTTLTHYRKEDEEASKQLVRDAMTAEEAEWVGHNEQPQPTQMIQ